MMTGRYANCFTNYLLFCHMRFYFTQELHAILDTL